METFSPFPLRARGVIEQFDAAIKLYKQYFWVLLGWSAVVTIASVVSGLIGFFLSPIAIGAVACCVAAAVRGQNVEFGQCWRFTQSRYWQALWYSFVATLAGGLVIAVTIGAVVALMIAGRGVFENLPQGVFITSFLFVLIAAATLVTIVSTVFISWIGLVPIVVCLEDDKRNSQSLGRAFDLLRGNWMRATWLMALSGAAILVLGGILGGVASLLVGFDTIRELMSGRPGNSAILAAIRALVGFGSAYTLLWMLWTPLYYLILTVFYLDVRVRREALDLEWTAHATAPSTPLREATTPATAGLYGTQPLNALELSATSDSTTPSTPPSSDTPRAPW
jgi:hypothetical protein